MALTRLAVALILAVMPHVAAGYKFLAIGDWGKSFDATDDTDCTGSVTPQQQQDATAMGNYALANNVAFTLLLGDNFYGSGIHGDANSCRFQKTFEGIYHASSLESIPFYAIAGNHDHGGNVSAQIAYTALSKRWVYPDWYYSVTKSFEDDGSNVTLQIVMIDTVLLGVIDGTNVYGSMADKPGTPLPKDAPSKQQQLDWLEKTLAASTADYLFVAGHYPVWSGCEHGNTAELQLDVKPMLEKYNVTGYLAGHDHCEQFIDDGKGPVYLVTGSGFECCYQNKNAHTLPNGATKFAYWSGDCPTGAVCPPSSPNSAFTAITATRDSLVMDIIDSAGKTLFTTDAIQPRTAAQKRGATVAQL